MLTVEFKLEGQRFAALNGGPAFHLSPAISFMVTCETQGELDRLWDALSEGGETMQCGWLTDRFGVSWQLEPAGLLGMLQDPDPQKAERAWRAMLQMTKLDGDALRSAYEGAGAA